MKRLLWSRSPMRRRKRGDNPRGRLYLLGDLLLLLGALGLLVAGFLYLVGSLGWGNGLPRPVALAGVSEEAAEKLPLPVALAGVYEGETTSRPFTDAPSTEAPIGEPAVFPIPSETPTPSPTPTPMKPGTPVRMVIPSIDVDSQVQEIGTYEVDGQLYWETVPFIVGHYRMTAKAGERGNAVFSGHVTSRNAGNVFKDLYKVKLGDKIRIFTEENEFTYEVSRIRLVAPTEISVMDATPDATATLITCAGEWNSDRREFSQRLIVVAKLKLGRTISE